MFRSILSILIFVSLFGSAFAQSDFSAKSIRSAVDRFLTKRLDSTFRYEIATSVRDEHFDEDSVTAHCVANLSSVKGGGNVTVEFVSGQRILLRREIPVFFRRVATVAVTRVTIKMGEVLTQENIAVEERDVTYQQEFVGDPTAIIGSVAKRTLLPGNLVSKSSVYSSGAVKRGETVDLLVVVGGVVIHTRATALADAEPGQGLRISREGSGQLLDGVLQDDKTVLLNR